MPLPQILICDDDSAMRSLLADYFSTQKFEVIEYELASEAFQAIQTQSIKPDLIISDIKMPEMDGLTFVDQLKSIQFDAPIILITAFGSIETAIQSVRMGAYDYIVKPFKLSELQVSAARALEYVKLKKDNHALRQEVNRQWTLGKIIGKSPQMQSVFDMIQRVSQVNANVLIMGESGTGKEVVAKAIHENGPRSNAPFVAINCTAIPETLLESELFGHAKGSFTGANQRKKGLFEEAEGGTLFLDEIGDMDPALQVKLLRVLQEKKIRAVGDTASRDINVRIIAATHKDLKQAIREGRFREDLYYRLSVIPVQIPPLRHRKEDIPLLANFFLQKYTSSNGLSPKRLSESAISKLTACTWEGNVRELENVIERTVVMSSGDIIEASEIPTQEESTSEDFYASATQEFPTLEDLEKKYIHFIMEKTGGRKSKAAQILGINRRTLYRKEREYGWVSEDESSSSNFDN